MSSLSTSLRSAYAKILLDFDIYEEEEQAARNNEKMKTWWNLKYFVTQIAEVGTKRSHFIKKLKYTAMSLEPDRLIMNLKECGT